MMNEKEILKKVLSGSMSGEERKSISEQDPVMRHLKKQWDDPANDLSLSPDARKRLLDRITKRINKPNTVMLRWKYFGIAASLAILVSFCYWFVGTGQADPQIVYVVSAGRQSMEAFYLPDGSHVSLNAGSKLTYPEHFSGKNREISLSGQAFFKVHHDPQHPFIVKTKAMDVKALGTSFELFTVDSASYTEMILTEGAVEVSTKREEGEGDVYLVNPDEKLAYVMNGKVNIEKVDAKEYSSWYRGGKPSFKNEKLAMILPRLESWYGVRIDCPEEVADKYSFTFSIHNEPVELLLNIISNSSPVAYQRREGGFVLHEKK